MGKGLECRTVLVFPPGKSWHAQVCASKLLGFATVYRAWADARAADSGSREDSGFSDTLVVGGD
jgi:hypothetical protein